MKPELIFQRIADEEMLNDFLVKWRIDQLRGLTIDQYTGVGNKKTFCQYVENQTRPLGSINGRNSSKFGIYKMKNKEAKPKGTDNNGTYAWMKKFDPQNTGNYELIFDNVISEVQKVANHALMGDFAAIEDFQLDSIFKWKVAYLYSNNRLIPIFTKTNLLQIVNSLGMNANYRVPYYEMQQFLMALKPFDQTVVEYMRKLFNELRIRIDEVTKTRKSSGKRKSVSIKSTTVQHRKGNSGYSAGQFHNDIQNALHAELCAKHGVSNVHMELNWVDILVDLEDKIILYEIKSDRYASNCIVSGLGQILGYAFRAAEFYNKKVELIIAGANDSFDNEIAVIEYIFKQIKLPISYHKIDFK
jgi:hypothetical protein